jgi:hypothetical protein
LYFFVATSSSSKGVGDNGGVIGMSSSPVLTEVVHGGVSLRLELLMDGLKDVSTLLLYVALQRLPALH